MDVHVLVFADEEGVPTLTIIDGDKIYVNEQVAKAVAANYQAWYDADPEPKKIVISKMRVNTSDHSGPVYEVFCVVHEANMLQLADLDLLYANEGRANLAKTGYQSGMTEKIMVRRMRVDTRTKIQS